MKAGKKKRVLLSKAQMRSIDRGLPGPALLWLIEPGIGNTIKATPFTKASDAADVFLALKKKKPRAKGIGLVAAKSSREAFERAEAGDFVTSTTLGKNPKAKKHEVFHFLLSSWDIDVADSLLAASPREPRVVDIADTCEMRGLIRIDPKTKKKADLTIPIYIAPFRYKGGVDLLPIDGWHRIARACDEGVEELPAIFFTEKEAKRIRIR